MKHLAVLAMCAAVIALQGCGGKSRQPAPVEARPAVAPAPAEPATEAPPETAAVAVADPAAKPPTPTRAQFEAMMATTVVILEAMAAAVANSGGDCGVAAAGIEKVRTDNLAFLKDMKKYNDDPEMDRRAEEWLTAHTDELMKPAMAVATMGEQCATDPAFKAALEKITDR